MKGLSFAIVLCFPILLFAQNEVEVSATRQGVYDSIRGEYVKNYPDHFFLWPVIKQRKLEFELRNIVDNKDKVAFKTNKPYSLGVGMYIFELGLELAFAVPLDEQSKAIYGETDSRDFQINSFGKRWGVEGHYQEYHGFYVDDLTTDIPANTPYPQRGDIRTRNIGLTGNYVFSSKKFSYRSAYNYSERQLKSAGSFLVFGSLNGFKAYGDSALLGTAFASRMGSDALLNTVDITTLAAAPGYAYNLVFKGFFLNGTLAVGPAHNWIRFTRDDGIEVRSTKFDAYLTTRVSIGYNGDTFFGGLTFVTQSRGAKFENVSLSSTNTSVKMMFGYRIKEFGILKRRAADIPNAIFKKK